MTWVIIYSTFECMAICKTDIITYIATFNISALHEDVAMYYDICTFNRKMFNH